MRISITAAVFIGAAFLILIFMQFALLCKVHRLPAEFFGQEGIMEFRECKTLFQAAVFGY